MYNLKILAFNRDFFKWSEFEILIPSPDSARVRKCSIIEFFLGISPRYESLHPRSSLLDITVKEHDNHGIN